VYEVVRRRVDFGRVWLFHGARTPRDLLYADEYAGWSAAGVEVETTVDRGDDSWRGHVGVITTLLDRARFDPSRACVMTCGPEVMMRFVAREALGRGVPDERVFLATERAMNCGFGQCGHCQLGPLFVCKDGPVFSYRQVAALLNVEGL
jgi:NAD(P)H-flavin reductase